MAFLGFPLYQQSVDVSADSAGSSSIESAPVNSAPVKSAQVNSAQPIAIATLPPTALAAVSSSQTYASPLVLNEPAAQAQTAQQAITPQPIPPQPLSVQRPPVLPEAPLQPLVELSVESVRPSSAPVTPPLATDEFQPAEFQPAPVLDPETESAETKFPEAEQLEAGMVVSLDNDFPHLAGAQGNCYNLSSCYRLSDAGGYRQAAKALVEQMEGQGYTVNEREDIEGAGRRVFEVVMPGQPSDIYFLNVFSDEAGSAVYVLTMDILTLHELQQLRA